MVAISRVLLGAHFFTDVIVGGYISIAVFYLLTEWMYKKPQAGQPLPAQRMSGASNHPFN
ncbi:phosphatase PAP2 family protein [Paenibacillus sp. strain BS8-2]